MPHAHHRRPETTRRSTLDPGPAGAERDTSPPLSGRVTVDLRLPPGISGDGRNPPPQSASARLAASAPLASPRWRFPLVHLMELGCWLVLSGSAFAVWSFLHANAVVHGHPGVQALPPSWEAAVATHGKHYRWFLPDRHPGAFAIAIAGVIGALGSLHATQKLKRAALGADPSAWQSIYQLADTATIVALLLAALAFDTWCFVPV